MAAISNVDGDSAYVRVQVLTNAGALDREKQLAVVSQFTELIAAAAGRHLHIEAGRGCCSPKRSMEAGDLAGHAHTNAELVAAARAQIAELRSDQTS